MLPWLLSANCRAGGPRRASGDMRITGGTARGRIISAPAGLRVRPTASKTRQAFFNILGGRTAGSRFLDLFAGSGLMGFEALSRGASALTSVEADRLLARAIEENLQRLGFSGEVICGQAIRVVSMLAPRQFDIIFADPPYGRGLAAETVEAVDRHRLLAGGGLMAVEHAAADELPALAGALEFCSRRKYGQCLLSFYRWRPDP